MNLSFELNQAKSHHIMVLTGEPSGDLHAANLVSEIKKIDPNIYISGIGGPHLLQQEVDLFYDIEKLSVMGITEVLMQLGQIKKAYDLFKEKLKFYKPDLIILVDYPGFNLKAAQYAKENYNLKILYFIPPKVWAWNRSRLKKIKKYVDHAALILPFEQKIYKKSNIPATYVGNPLMDEYPENISKPFTRSNNLLNKDKDSITIGLIPGSRKTEVKKLLAIMIKAANLIYENNKKTKFIISKAGSIQKQYIESFLKKSDNIDLFQVHEGQVKDIFIKSDLVIAASGTVTLEAALCCVPTILIYKLSIITHAIAKVLVKLKYAGLANLIVDKEVMPELLQYDATPGKINTKALYMLDHLKHFENQLQPVRKFLGRNGASKSAANIVINLIRQSQ